MCRSSRRAAISRRVRGGLVFAAGFLLLAARGAATQTVDELRGRYRLPVPGTTELVHPRYRWTLPAMGANTPSGFGAEWGDVWVAASFQERTRFLNRADGSVGFGFGLGDARRALGLRVSVVSFSTARSGFGDRIGVDVHLHRRLPARFGVAVGWENAIRRGGGDSGRSKYLAVSRYFQTSRDARSPFSLVVLSVGMGTDRFQSEDAFRSGEDGVGVFGSAAIRVLAPWSLIGTWTGQDLLLATSLAPFRDHGLVITAGLADVLGTAGDGARVVLGGGMRWDFRRRPARILLEPATER